MVPQTFKQDIVTKTVREWIAAGKYRCGDRLPTNMELADLFGINHQTVAHGLQPLVEEGLLECAPRRGTVVRGAAVKPVSNAVAFIAHSRGDKYSEMARLLDGLLMEHGLYPVTIDYNILGEPEKIQKFIQRLLSMQQPYGYIAEGLAYYPYNFLRSAPERCANTVFIYMYHNPVEIPFCRYVLTDFADMGRGIAEWFAAKGAKKIAFPALPERNYLGPWSSMQIQVMNALSKRCAELGMSFNEPLFWRCHGGAPLREMLKDVFSGPERPDALFAWSDSHAERILNELAGLGYHYPQDYLLMGSHNTPHSAKCGFPTMDLRFPEIITKAVELLTNESSERKILIKPIVVEHQPMTGGKER